MNVLGASYAATLLALSCATTLTFSTNAAAQVDPKTAVTTVLLVHGAWVDGSSWAKVVPALESKGLSVISVQIPLTSLADDVAATRRAIALADGPVLLVGHSYGGVVITEAGSDPRVKGLVYIAAFAPDTGESSVTLLKTVPDSPAGAELRPDAAGFLKLTEKGINEDFAEELSAPEKKILFATQIPTSVTALGAPVSQAAWKTKPSWFLVTTKDRVVPVELARNMAHKLNADTVEVASCHAVIVAHPEEVSSLIIKAAQGVGGPR
ncbi:MAG: alpha/beta hydrolase [Candidatus Sulfotelmatobacter sp.]|jgi:pimeloyl-ACP methyl ester carboxylesterase